MSYIGQRPVVGRYIKLDQISSGFNGSETSFSMTAGSQAVFPGTARNLLLSLGGVIQEPDTNFTISGSTLTFTTAPVANTTFFAVIFGDMQSTGTPSDGTVLPASIASSGNFSFPQLTVTGTSSLGDDVTFTGANYNVVWDKSADALEFPDGAKAVFGTGSDVEIYHDGTNSRIHSSSHNLYIRTGGIFGVFNGAGSETMLKATVDGAVELYYDNVKRFETTAGGTIVTGTLDVTDTFSSGGNIKTGTDTGKFFAGASNDLQIYHDGSTNIIDAATSNAISFRRGNTEQFFIGNAEFKGGDNKKIKLGTGDDLEIYHDGTNSYIANATGGLRLSVAGGSNQVQINKGTVDEQIARFIADGAVELYYDNVKTFATKAGGNTLYGTDASGNVSLGRFYFKQESGTVRALYDPNAQKFQHYDNTYATFGNGDDLKIYHDGTHSRIDNATGAFYIRNNTGTYNGNPIQIQPLATEDSVKCIPNGTVELYYDNSKKFETTSTGIDVTGRVTSDELSVIKTSGNLSANFEAQSGLGTLEIGGSTGAFIDLKTPFSDDFDIRFNSDGTLTSKGNIQLNVNGNENGVHVIANGAVDLYHNNSKKFETTSAGTKISGDGEALRIQGVDGDTFMKILGNTNVNVILGQLQDQGFVGNSTNHDFFIRTNNANRISISNSGTLSGDLNDTSDENLKENIVSISDGAISDIKKLRPVNFDWKDSEKAKNQSGFIAQEVKTIFPNLVVGEEYDESKADLGYAINTSGVVAHLTKALQEAIVKIETLEAKVAALEAA